MKNAQSLDLNKLALDADSLVYDWKMDPGLVERLKSAELQATWEFLRKKADSYISLMLLFNAACTAPREHECRANIKEEIEAAEEIESLISKLIIKLSAKGRISNQLKLRLLEGYLLSIYEKGRPLVVADKQVELLGHLDPALYLNGIKAAVSEIAAEITQQNSQNSRKRGHKYTYYTNTLCEITAKHFRSPCYKEIADIALVAYPSHEFTVEAIKMNFANHIKRKSKNSSRKKR